MASAGRILIMPKGNYNTETEYEMLDLVFHNGKSWVAKKTVQGIEPSEAEMSADYWMKMCESIDLTEVHNRISAIENQMLSTLSLDDIDLSGCATKEELANYATKSDLNNYLKLTGGTLKGDLGLTNGNGGIVCNEYGTMIRAVKDGSNYRGLKVDNPKFANDLNTCARLVNAVGGVETEYKLFGEHNKDLLLNLISASISGVKFESGSLPTQGYGGEMTSTRTITCSFMPKLLVIIGCASTGASASISLIIPDIGLGTTTVTNGNTSVGIVDVTKDGNNIILNHTRTESMAYLYTCAAPGLNYTYLSIG